MPDRFVEEMIRRKADLTQASVSEGFDMPPSIFSDSTQWQDVIYYKRFGNWSDRIFSSSLARGINGPIQALRLLPKNANPAVP
jgi:hypothetical protein